MRARGDDASPNGAKAAVLVRARPAGQWIVGLEGLSGERDVVARNVERMRQRLQPGEIVGIEPDHAGIGHRALAEVEPAVGADRDHVGVVIPATRQSIQNGPRRLARDPAADPAGKAALRDIETAGMPGQAVHRLAQTVEHDSAPAIRFDTNDAAAGPRAAERQAALRHMAACHRRRTPRWSGKSKPCATSWWSGDPSWIRLGLAGKTSSSG